MMTVEVFLSGQMNVKCVRFDSVVYALYTYKNLSTQQRRSIDTNGLLNLSEKSK